MLHDRLATTALFYTGALGLWATWLALRGRGLEGSYMGALVIGQTLLVVQSLLGAWMMLTLGLAVVRPLHVLYGILGALMWPFLYTFSRGAGDRREAVLFAAGSFFLFLMLQRAVETA